MRCRCPQGLPLPEIFSFVLDVCLAGLVGSGRVRHLVRESDQREQQRLGLQRNSGLFLVHQRSEYHAVDEPLPHHSGPDALGRKEPLGTGPLFHSSVQQRSHCHLRRTHYHEPGRDRRQTQKEQQPEKTGGSTAVGSSGRRRRPHRRGEGGRDGICGCRASEILSSQEFFQGASALRQWFRCLFRNSQGDRTGLVSQWILRGDGAALPDRAVLQWTASLHHHAQGTLYSFPIRRRLLCNFPPF
mmetsp:Transcript_48689/g.146736  ORF Transcript_48689/g.146736 Transcript_48689/m.146736 type:complete len:243 (+) Transcript_48689:246-974(+)